LSDFFILYLAIKHFACTAYAAEAVLVYFSCLSVTLYSHMRTWYSNFSYMQYQTVLDFWHETLCQFQMASHRYYYMIQQERHTPIMWYQNSVIFMKNWP